VILQQFDLPCPAYASQVIRDEDDRRGSRRPQGDTNQYIAFAVEHPLKIKARTLTHFHPDS
jgi:hypothetical protein